MQKNDTVIVKIEDIGVTGEGIGKVDGYTLFIKDAVIGDVIEAKVMKAKKNYGYARLIRVVAPSKYRVEPKCRFARKCGGCQIQEMSYEQQLVFKQKKVYDNLERIGGFATEHLEKTMEPIVGMKEPFYYRNKAQFPFGTDKNGNPVTGFYAGRTHDIIANTDCALGVAVNREILELILDFMEKHRISPYDEKTGSGLLRHVLIRFGFATKEIMVCFVVNKEKGKTEWIPYQEELIGQLCKIQGMKSISVSPNTKRSNVIMGESYEVLWGQGYITDYIGTVQYQISPLSFYQVNPVQTEKLYKLALAYAGLKSGEEKKAVVWDLYCGIGTISLFLAQQAQQVYGVEIVPQAIDDARRNAKINGIENTEFYVGKAEEILPAYYEKYTREHSGETARADVIVVDPPRKGCEESLLKTMLDMKPERIVYVSCDSATLARDLKYLCSSGAYELVKWRAVDQFPMSVHVETVVLLSKGAKDPVDLCSARTEVERRMVDSRKVKVDFSLEDMDLSEFKGKATYEQIKAYVLEQTGLKVSSLYIAQIKKKCGLDVGENFNLAKSENTRQPQCTTEKEEAIMQAFSHFGIK